MTRLVIAGALLLVGCAGRSGPLPPGEAWTPAAWSQEDTVELRADCPDEGEHWFPVWLVVLDDQLYVRLGGKASARVQCTRGMPLLGVRIAGRQFDKVRATETADLAPRVGQAMRDKYWTDVFVRGVSHPLTMRLVAEPAAAQR